MSVLSASPLLGLLLSATAVAQSTVLSEDVYVKAFNVSAAEQFGQAVAVSGEWMAVTAPQDDSAAIGIGGDGFNTAAPLAGAVYMYRFEGGQWVFEAYIKPSNTDSGDLFGSSVAISGNLMVVGARWESSSSTQIGAGQGLNDASAAGAAYVFEYRDTMGAPGWVQTAYLKASNAEAQDEFGGAVDIVSLPGLNPWIAVGASGEDSSNGQPADNGAASSGAVYLFEGSSASAWVERGYLKAAVPDAGDFFGNAVSVAPAGPSGPIQVLIGAPGEDSADTVVNGNEFSNGAPDSGAAYFYQRNGSNWIRVAYLKADNAEAGDSFGVDVDYDGFNMTVGAPWEDSSVGGVNPPTRDNLAMDAGAAYSFIWSPMGFILQVGYIKAAQPGTNDYFGSCLALSPSQLAVGAPGEASASTGIDGDELSNGAPFSGAAYLFDYNADTNIAWTQEAFIKASNAELPDVFGSSIALSDRWLLVGAAGEDGSSAGLGSDPLTNGAIDAGAAYSFRLGDGAFLNYCLSRANSTGLGASIQGAGTGLLAQNDVVLTAGDLPPNSFGFFLVSANRGFVQMPGGSQGFLCLGAEIGRYVGPGQIQSSGLQGVFTLPVDSTMIPTPNGPAMAMAGDELHFQAWYRDAIGGLPVSNFTGALTVLFR